MTAPSGPGVDERALDGILGALASPVRRRLLDQLAEGDRSVGALAAPFDVSRPAISQHLRILLEAGLVSEQRAGRERRYRLEAGRLRLVQWWLGTYERFWRDRLANLGDYLDETPDLDNGPQTPREETP
jgi:DNA-binding transcriptional ArsR family regulator